MSRARPVVPTPRQVLRWVFGVPLATLQWLRRRGGIDRSTTDHAGAMPAPARALQGTGPGFHRLYWIRIAAPDATSEQVIAAIRRDPNVVSPTHVARFEAEGDGRRGELQVGDEFDIELAGPWNGPVRVLEAGATSFRLGTRDGHPETGEIEFRCRAAAKEDLQFEIESWARSSDRLSSFVYDDVGLAREMQLNMWAHVLEQVVVVAGGTQRGDVNVHTDRYAGGVERARGDGPPTRGARRHLARGRRELEALARAGWNVDAIPTDPKPPWRIDQHRQPLPGESPGAPEPGGPWQVALRLAHDYEFVDPSIIRAVYDRDAPLQGRTMALHGRFLTLDFWMGVRVTRVFDEPREVDGRAVRVGGYAYRTLERHLEVGEISFEVWKWLDTGEVEFRMRAVSRSGRIGNPFVRVGFRIFGRGLQLTFARRARERMLELVTAELRGRAADAPGAVVEGVAPGPE